MNSELLLTFAINVLPWLLLLTLVYTLVRIPLTKVDKITLKRGLWVFVVVVLVILWPVLSYLVSMLFAPMSKALAHHGWIDSFHAGKIALLPLVLWASAALYVFETWPPPPKRHLWQILGIFIGTLIYAAVLAHMVFTSYRRGWFPVSVTPIYLLLWFGYRTIQVIRNSAYSLWPYVFTLVGSTPFWIYSVILSKKNHAGLPETSDCFIVTAAASGHESVVGPLIPLECAGHHRTANQQLLTFWKLEKIWLQKHPRFHQMFRKIYDCCGARAARLIRNRWLADGVYILLKPFEWLARLYIAQEQARQ